MNRTWSIVIYSTASLVTSAVIATAGFIAGRRSAARAIALETHVVQADVLTTDNGQKRLKSAKLVKKQAMSPQAEA